MWLNLPEYTVRYLLFFTNCSIATIRGQSTIQPIACASNSDDGVFVIPSELPHQTLSQECKQVLLVPVLQNASLTIDSQWSTNGYRNALKQGFQLGWNLNRKSEQCTKCEGSNGGCAHSRDGEFVACLCTNGRVNGEECTNGKPILCSTIVLPFLFSWFQIAKGVN